MSEGIVVVATRLPNVHGRSITSRNLEQSIVTTSRGGRAGVACGEVQGTVRRNGDVAEATVQSVEQVFCHIDPFWIGPVEMYSAKVTAVQRGDEEIVREARDSLLRVEHRTGRINRRLKCRGGTRSEQEVEEEIATLPVAPRQPQASGDRLPVEAADDRLSRRDDRRRWLVALWRGPVLIDPEQ